MYALTNGARRAASACLLPLVRRAARAYVAGERLDDALSAARALAERDLACTLGYWDAPTDSPRQVADTYLAALSAWSNVADGYLSIKLTALGFSPELLGEVADAAHRANVRLHFDAMAADTAEHTRTMVERLLPSGVEAGFTLPGRWQRSLEDADWAAARKLPVRVVKGQWADPEQPHRDPRIGFLEVIDRLAGRARQVAVASHDVRLAAEAIRRLQQAGTPCTLELLFGLPRRELLRVARERRIAVRVYVPYGATFLPYALSRMSQNPRIAWWLVRDMILAN